MEQVTKILIVGSKGMAGHVLFQYLTEATNFIIVDIARGTECFIPSHQIDVTNFEQLKEILQSECPNYVVNCIGILNQDAERNPDKAILLNSYLPHFLAKCGRESGFKLIHISTDCVFNGQTGGYNEKSPTNGIGIYAQSKALGEVTYGGNLTLRTSIIGPELKANGIGLFNWFMHQTGNIQGYSQAYWTGVTTLELAKAIVSAISQDLSGLHHLVNGEKISKFNLTGIFKQVFDRKSLEIEPYDGYKVDKSLLKTNDVFRYSVPSYEEMIQNMKEWMETHPAFYKHYLADQ